MSVILQSSSGGSITLSEPATASNFTQTLPSASGTVMVSGNQPAFSAYLATTQSVSAGTWTKIQYNTENFDTNSNYDNSAYRFTPTVAGYYQVSASGALDGNATYLYLAIYKNGSAVVVSPYAAVGGVGGVAVGLIYLNGSTDYVEGYALKDGLASLTGGASGYTLFQGVLVRAA